MLFLNINYFCIISLIAAPLLGSDTVCDSNSCYTFIEDKVTWSEASRICSDKGQSLFDISSGIPYILRTIINYSIEDGRPRHSSLLCPSISFWAHSKQGKMSKMSLQSYNTYYPFV